MHIIDYLSRRKKIFDRAVLARVPRGQKQTKPLSMAIKYSLMSGGKRIRPILVMAACEAVSGSYEKALPAAIAIEMIHTYTLIHDDLPAMDNDDLRRGKPTCHKVFGEDVAILAGDALNTLAFQIMSEEYGNMSSRLISELSESLGIDGVVGGQFADLKSAGKSISMAELRFISINKTARLFIASARIGAIVGRASGSELKELTGYAEHLGLAFQIIDDILDYKGEKGEKGQKRGKGEAGYPGLIGLDRAKQEAEKEVKLAIRSLPAAKSHDILREIALFLSNRED